tara:strand:- start:103 stop:333 length:231 start_codon:yes stop_codon:yes gene_type:complete
MTDSSHFWIVSGVTFCVFFGEALIHYNYGILESKNLPWRISNFTIPKGKSLLKMSAIVVVASAISGMVIDRIEQKA